MASRKIKTTIRNVIKVKKAITFKTQGGKVTFKPGKVLWTGKPNEHNWTSLLDEEGFMLAHFYCYGQCEIIPWSHLSLVTYKIREETIKTVEVKERPTKDSFIWT